MLKSSLPLIFCICGFVAFAKVTVRIFSEKKNMFPYRRDRTVPTFFCPQIPRNPETTSGKTTFAASNKTQKLHGINILLPLERTPQLTSAEMHCLTNTRAWRLGKHRPQGHKQVQHELSQVLPSPNHPPITFVTYPLRCNTSLISILVVDQFPHVSVG